MKCGRRRGHQLDHTSLLLEQASGPWTLHRYAGRIPVLHTCTLVIVRQLFFWSLRSSFPSFPPSIIHPISHPVLSLIPSWVCSHTFPADHSRPFSLFPFLLAFLLRCQIYLPAFCCCSPIVPHHSRTPADPSTSPTFKRRPSRPKHTLVADTTR